jgi:hypothetical protein
LPAPVPERLARFVRDEWPEATWDAAVKAWRNACADWLAADTDRAPHPGMPADLEHQRWWLAGGSRRKLPFGEYGDAIDVIREGRSYRRAGDR